MQIFLDANPRYWRFVPMSMEEAQTPEQQHIQRPQFAEELNWNLRSKEDSLKCINAVPKPPSAYTFSNRQILLQTTYFHKKQDQILPNQDLDLYNATIVAVCKFDMFMEIKTGIRFHSLLFFQYLKLVRICFDIQLNPYLLLMLKQI